VALERSFLDLDVHLRRLKDDLLGLRLTVVEDKPLRRGVVLVEQIGDTVEELVGWLEEALAAAAEGRGAVGQPVDLDRARRALTRCQERVHLIGQRFAAEIVSYERVEELSRFGRSRGGEWAAWVDVVRQTVGQCRPLLENANQALFFCSQELAERGGTTSVSVHATNVGQQFGSPGRGEAAREGSS
jgi:hypothetical protein